MTQKKYWFMSTAEYGGKVRLRAERLQTFPDGSEVSTAMNCQGSREQTTKFGLGSVFVTSSLTARDKFYSAADPLHCVVAVGDVPHDATEEEKEAYKDYCQMVMKMGSTGDAPKEATPKQQEEPAKKKQSLLEKIESYARFACPTVEEGWYVPKDLWFSLIWAIRKGKNIMIKGPSGVAKTLITKLLAEKLNREWCDHDMSGMTDPVSSLVGTHRIGAGGTSIFDYAKFAKDIQLRYHVDKKTGELTDREIKPIILLDEISRAPMGTNNLLFPVLDSRRKLPASTASSGDENLRDIPVSEHAVFMATANIGLQYTGTSTLDAALVSRFIVFELDFPPEEIEAQLLVVRTGVDKTTAKQIARYAYSIRQAVKGGNEITTCIDMRHTLTIAEMVADGFDLRKALETVILPLYDDFDKSTVEGLLKSR